MAITMIGLFLFCYLPLLPLAIKGTKFLNNSQLKVWILWSIIAGLSPLLVQYRWVLMATYPLAFCAVEAIANMRNNSRRLRVFVIFGTIVTVLSVGFMVMPAEAPFPYYAIPQFRIYVPSSMLQNSIALSDCQDTANALQWLKNNMNESSHLLVHTVFYGWALQYINSEAVICYGYDNPENAAKNAIQLGYNEIFLIWWVNGQGWHGQATVGPLFMEVYKSGKIALYTFKG
jgi:hypothetical protein